MKADYQRFPDSEYLFLLYDPEGNGLMFFRSAEERDAAARDVIDMYLDDGWAEEVSCVFAGEVTHHTVRAGVKMRPKREAFDSEEAFEDAMDEYGYSEWDYICNYELRPLSETDEPVEGIND